MAMTDETRLRAWYTEALARRAGGEAGEPDPEALDALAAGRLDDAQALPLLDRVMSDPGLLREYEMLRAIHAAGHRRSFAAPRWLALAAALTIIGSATVVWRATRSGDSPAAVRGGAAVVLVAPPPDAAVVEPVRLAWRAVPAAVRYVVEVTDAEGRAVMREETPDTVLAIPPGLLAAGSAYQWWVEARTPAGPVRSNPRRLAIAPPEPR
jgi:hypothetical protein